jgi:hypothetical protein
MGLKSWRMRDLILSLFDSALDDPSCVENSQK